MRTYQTEILQTPVKNLYFTLNNHEAQLLAVFAFR